MIGEGLLALVAAVIGILAAYAAGTVKGERDKEKEIKADTKEADHAEADAIRKRVADTDSVRPDDLRYRD